MDENLEMKEYGQGDVQPLGSPKKQGVPVDPELDCHFQSLEASELQPNSSE